MPNINANNIQIEYDTFGNPTDPALLMVMGLGAQMIAWDEVLCEKLASTGLFVIRYDNRDVGLSSHFREAGEPDMEALVMALLSGSDTGLAYTLDDMAADGIALLDALDIPAAHICGASMGGMIAQAMAINHPQRILSLTSIMSSTGNPELPPANPEAMAALGSERKDDPEHAAQRAVEISGIIGSPGFTRDEARIRRKALESYNRGHDPAGVMRQMAAIMAHGDRRAGLQQLTLPCLVIHGTDDPLVPLTGGIDTHESIKGSTLLEIPGMGHDLPVGIWDQVVGAIAELTLSTVVANH